MSIIQDIIGLVYPETCCCCNKLLINSEKVTCLWCLYNLPRTKYHLLKENFVFELFYGRANIENATSMFFFDKGTNYQRIIHKLKYKGEKDIGVEFGRVFGNEIKESEDYSNFDYIVPVPLHPDKMKRRGFNQSECIADGLSTSMNIDVNTHNLIRTINTNTQTKKSRFERFENTKDVFTLNEASDLNNKSVLLVDDVVTTGSTLEACSNVITDTTNCKVSIATLAVAKI